MHSKGATRSLISPYIPAIAHLSYSDSSLFFPNLLRPWMSLHHIPEVLDPSLRLCTFYPLGLLCSPS